MYEDDFLTKIPYSKIINSLYFVLLMMEIQLKKHCAKDIIFNFLSHQFLILQKLYYDFEAKHRKIALKMAIVNIYIFRYPISYILFLRFRSVKYIFQ